MSRSHTDTRTAVGTFLLIADVFGVVAVAEKRHLPAGSFVKVGPSADGGASFFSEEVDYLLSAFTVGHGRVLSRAALCASVCLPRSSCALLVQGRLSGVCVGC